MASNRVYIHFTLFNVRIVNMQHLWEPSREYKGQATQKPNYFLTGIVQKTRQNWWEEPTLAPAWAAYSELLNKSGMQPQMVAEWPIKDGDMPVEPGQQPAEWAKGRWILGGSSSNPLKIEMVQNGNVVPLANRVGVKPGDYIALGLSAAIKQNNARGLKHYCNTVLFMAAGEEIAVGNSVSGAELMRQAQAQGMQVAGFSGSPGGFPGAPQPGGFPVAPPQGTQPGFTPGAPQPQPQPQPGFPPQGMPGPVPTMGVPVAPHAVPNGFQPPTGPQMGNGAAAFPSSDAFPSR